MDTEQNTQLNRLRLAVAELLVSKKQMIYDNWIQSLEKAFKDKARTKMRYLFENKKHQQDLFSIFIRYLQRETDDEDMEIGPMLDKIWALDYSISDFFTEKICLESAIRQYLWSIESLLETKLATYQEVIYFYFNHLCASVLKESSELFEHIAETCKTGFCHTDSNGQISFANMEMQRLTGKQSLAGDNIEIFFEGAEKESIRKAISSQVHHRPDLQQFTLIPDSGDAFQVGMEIGPVVIDGLYKGGYAHISDISGSINIQNKIFNQSLLGIIKLDVDGKITFANRRLRQMTQLRDQQGLTIWDLLPDDKTRERVRKKLDDRINTGEGEEYELEIRRIRDKKKIPVMVSAFPIMDLTGTRNIGSFAIIRSIIAEKIHRHIETHREENSLLEAVAKELSLVVPFDLMAVSEYSSDLGHSRSIFSFMPDSEPTWERRWWEMTPARIAWARQKDVIMEKDLGNFLSQPEWKDLKKEKDIQWLLNEGFTSFIFYPVFADNRLVASLSLMRKSPRTYKEHHKGLLKSLPIDMAIQMALYYHQKRETGFVHELVKKIADMGSNIKEISRVIVEQIANHYGWDSVCLYKFNKFRQKFLLLKQAASDEKYRLDEDYEQDVGDGVIGYVYRTKEVVNIRDLSEDADFRNLYLPIVDGTMQSELCMALNFGEISWLLNIEDSRLNAFSKEEEKAVIRIMDEVCASLKKSWMSHFLETSLGASNDAVFVLDESHNIVNANASAVQMFDLPALEQSGMSASTPIARTKATPLREIFENPAEAENILKIMQTPDKAVSLKNPSGGTRPVLLSIADLQEDFGYTVLNASDLSTQKRLEEIENLGKLYFELAAQTKTPLSLVYGWLSRFKRRITNTEDLEVLDKVTRQLRKLEISYDRLALYTDDQDAIPFNPCLLDLATVLRDVKKELPKSDSQKIQWEYPKGKLLVQGDLFQLQFCVETVLAYLLRFVPEDRKMTAGAFEKKGKATVEITGWHPPKECTDDSGERQQQSELGRALVDMAFGEKVIKRFIRKHEGRYMMSEQDDEKISFVFEFQLDRE